MRRAVPLTFLIALTTGCWKSEELPQMVDRLSFQHVGGTLFANPDIVTMKEIHLDNGTKAGREIIIEGAMAEVSEHQTYFVLADDAARLLVVLTHLEPSAAAVIAKKPTGTVRVLGTIEVGKKGLPYILARAVTTVPAASSQVPGKA